MEKIAVIDLGTNTFHLLIAEVEDSAITILHKERIPVKIGEGGINKGVITPQAYKRGENALQYFSEIMNKYYVQNYCATATSAFRNAANAHEIIDNYLMKTGIKINIISGDLEAQLIYEGVKQTLTFDSDECYAIMDIGGGSVEFIICDDKQIHWKKSYEIGAQRLLTEFHQQDQITTDELTSLRSYLNETLTELKEKLKEFNASVLIGASGAFESVIEISNFGNDAHGTLCTPISFQEFNDVYLDLIHKNVEERGQIPGLIPLRVEMIVVALSLIDVTITSHEFKSIFASSYALKEGLIQRLIHKVPVV